VIEVTHDDFPKPARDERMQQNHRIAATGDADERWLVCGRESRLVQWKLGLSQCGGVPAPL
jgi:hypothetical protein